MLAAYRQKKGPRNGIPLGEVCVGDKRLSLLLLLLFLLLLGTFFTRFAHDLHVLHVNPSSTGSLILRWLCWCALIRLGLLRDLRPIYRFFGLFTFPFPVMRSSAAAAAALFLLSLSASPWLAASFV